MFQDKTKNAHAILAEAKQKVEKLRQINPYLIDLSLRESSVGDSIGQTLSEKIELLPKLRQFGFKDIVLGALNYSMPEEPEVDDDFMIHLQNQKFDMTGCFAFTSVGHTNQSGVFTPDVSLTKLKSYGIPNTILEIYLSTEGQALQQDFKTLCRSLPDSIQWLHQNISKGQGPGPRILVNIIDGCDAFSQNPDQVFSLLELLATQAIEGVSFQDSRGSFLPFQVGAFTAAARTFLPAPFKLLVHIHAGAGWENASVMEALLNGADGVWGSICKSGPVIGHASLAELIANLVRVDNPHMRDYQLDQLIPLTEEFRPVGDLYVLGKTAYTLPLSSFRQAAGRYMDLAPEIIGGQYHYRICPLVSTPQVIAGRLAEVTGRPSSDFSEDVLNKMIKLMRQDLRAGLQVSYNEAENLLKLFARASV